MVIAAQKEMSMAGGGGDPTKTDPDPDDLEPASDETMERFARLYRVSGRSGKGTGGNLKHGRGDQPQGPGEKQGQKPPWHNRDKQKRQAFESGGAQNGQQTREPRHESGGNTTYDPTRDRVPYIPKGKGESIMAQQNTGNTPRTGSSTNQQGEYRVQWRRCILCLEVDHAETSRDGKEPYLVCTDCHNKFLVARARQDKKDQAGLSFDDFLAKESLPPSLKEEPWIAGQINLEAIEAAMTAAQTVRLGYEGKIQGYLIAKKLWYEGATGPTSDGEEERKRLRSHDDVKAASRAAYNLGQTYAYAKALLKKYPQPEPVALSEKTPSSETPPTDETESTDVLQPVTGAEEEGNAPTGEPAPAAEGEHSSTDGDGASVTNETPGPVVAVAENPAGDHADETKRHEDDGSATLVTPARLTARERRAAKAAAATPAS